MAALSQNMSGYIAGSAQSEKNMTMNTSDESDSGMHCHDKAAQKNVIQVDIKATQITQHAMQMSSIAKKSSINDCCCDDGCQCSSDMACQSVTHTSASAIILQSTVFISSPLNSQLATESVVLYHDCDTDSEVIPPIA